MSQCLSGETGKGRITRAVTLSHARIRMSVIPWCLHASVCNYKQYHLRPVMCVYVCVQAVANMDAEIAKVEERLRLEKEALAALEEQKQK